jgi:transposase
MYGVTMSGRFIAADRETTYFFPPSVQEWISDKHLARFVVEIVDQLDMVEIEAAYSGRGSSAYHPKMLTALLFYGYATGIFSSRKLEIATYDLVPCRYIAANEHPDHDTIATFRRRFPSAYPIFQHNTADSRRNGSTEVRQRKS